MRESKLCEQCGNRLFISEEILCNRCVKRRQHRRARESADIEKGWQRLKKTHRKQIEEWGQE